jgi:hypothetical protein
VGPGNGISVHVEMPDTEAHRLDTQHEIVRQSLIRLADQAAALAKHGLPAGLVFLNYTQDPVDEL